MQQATMRAKVQVNQVRVNQGHEELILNPVCGSGAYGPNGESEDNTFARYTPSGEIKLTVNNPSLLGKFKPGQKFYVDFTEAPGQ